MSEINPLAAVVLANEFARTAKGHLCPHCGSPQTRGYGRHRNENIRRRCADCKATFTSDRTTRGNNYIKPEKKEALLAALARPGVSLRDAAKESGVSKATAMTYAQAIERPLCFCGEPSAHKGWCAWRFARSPKRQSFIKTIQQSTIRPWQRPSILWLGQVFNPTHSDHVTHVTPCSTNGCVFPGDSSGKCAYHLHFFDYKWSMEWRAVGYSDIYPTEDNPQPLLSSMQGWELDHSADRTNFDYKGQRDKGEKLSDDWWRENVLQARTPQYAPEVSTGNVQHTGAFVLWKGFGKKKIRKSQRNRPAGWHGNHPEQKPVKRYSRESLDELPIWEPPKRIEAQDENTIESDEFLPDEEDRESAIALLSQDPELSEEMMYGDE